MRVLLRYFLLEYKRIQKVFLRSAGSMLAMLILIILGVSVCSYILLQTQIFHYIDVGVVIPKEEDEARLIAQYISSMDSVKSICDFHYVEYEDAMDGLEANEFQVVIEIPKELCNSLYAGSHASAKIYFPENAPLNVKVFRELFFDGVSIVQISEAGMCAANDVAEQKETNIKKNKIGDVIATAYIMTALGRDDIFDFYTESPLGQMNVTQYYVSALFMLFLLMCGLNFGCLYQPYGKPVEQKLSMYGVGRGKVSFAKILVMTVTLWTIGVLMYGALCLVSGMTDNIGVWFESRAVFWLFFLCLGLASYFHTIYVVAGSGFQGTVLLFAVNIGMLLCAGIILPVAYLPKMISEIGNYLPLHFWNEFGAGVLFGEVGKDAMLLSMGFFVVALAVGGIRRWKDI